MSSDGTYWEKVGRLSVNRLVDIAAAAEGATAATSPSKTTAPAATATPSSAASPGHGESLLALDRPFSVEDVVRGCSSDE
jgi:hypothetical protein